MKPGDPVAIRQGQRRHVGTVVEIDGEVVVVEVKHESSTQRYRRRLRLVEPLPHLEE